MLQQGDHFGWPDAEEFAAPVYLVDAAESGARWPPQRGSLPGVPWRPRPAAGRLPGLPGLACWGPAAVRGHARPRRHDRRCSCPSARSPAGAAARFPMPGHGGPRSAPGFLQHGIQPLMRPEDPGLVLRLRCCRSRQESGRDGTTSSVKGRRDGYAGSDVSGSGPGPGARRYRRRGVTGRTLSGWRLFNPQLPARGWDGPVHRRPPARRRNPARRRGRPVRRWIKTVSHPHLTARPSAPDSSPPSSPDAVAPGDYATAARNIAA